MTTVLGGLSSLLDDPIQVKADYREAILMQFDGAAEDPEFSGDIQSTLLRHSLGRYTAPYIARGVQDTVLAKVFDRGYLREAFTVPPEDYMVQENVHTAALASFKGSTVILDLAVFEGTPALDALNSAIDNVGGQLDSVFIHKDRHASSAVTVGFSVKPK